MSIDSTWPEPFYLWKMPTVARLVRASFDPDSRAAELDFCLSNPDLELALVFTKARGNPGREYRPTLFEAMHPISYDPIPVPWPEFERIVEEAEPKIVAYGCTIHPVRNIAHVTLSNPHEGEGNLSVRLRYDVLEANGIDSLEMLAEISAKDSESR